MLLGLGAIPLIFYIYNGVIGKSPDWVNIAIFFISCAVVYIYEYRRLNDADQVCASPRRAILAICFMALLFVVFTFRVPGLEIFKDPITSAYGIGQ